MSPSIHFSMPSGSLFQFPPSNDPRVVPAPATESLLTPSFYIPADIYSAVLEVKVPITIAAIYAVTVTALNAYNRSRDNKPWRISKTKPFFAFVVLHNVFLAVYSAWTFVGMWNALKVSLSGHQTVAGPLDALCKVHGPYGLGNAVTYNSSWTSHSADVQLTSAGLPSPMDAGRLWNEGLAFYGWFFYLSKFYEVLDTLIILAKGKRSSTLQTYHHAGAMMSMWCGIRFMSPPIWMFVFVNSGIHALMYTYYTLTAFAVPIPNRLKRSLTTMQIIQFLVGASYAALHSFISYTIPVRVEVSKPASQAATTSATSAFSSATAAATAANFVDMIKVYLFRAIGMDGVAGNVNAINVPKPEVSTGADGISYTTEYQSVPCIDTSGQTFAIWFNVLYLAPLTVLFVRFFIRSYIRRTSKQVPKKIQNGKANGSANGHANGKANGFANGKANGKH